MTDFMFLDTVQLCIALNHVPECKKYPFSDRNAWTYSKTFWGSRYLFSKKVRHKIEKGWAEYVPTVIYDCRLNGGLMKYELKIEFSIPKLLYLQNFYPVPSAAIDDIFDKLCSILAGVYGFEEIERGNLERATLSRIDCSTVVCFSSQAKLDRALQRIKSADLNSRIAIDEPAFSTRSHGVNAECNSWQFVFYDKSKEYRDGLKKMSNESYWPSGYIPADSDSYNCHALTGKVEYEDKGEISFLPDNILHAHEAKKRYLQCELRLNTKDKINRALKRIGEEPREFTLRSIVDERIPHRILQYHWEMIIQCLPRLELVNSMQDIVTEVLNGGYTPKKTNEIIGACYLLKETSTQATKPLYKELHGRNSWVKLKASIPPLPGLQNAQEPVQPITEAIFGPSRRLQVRSRFATCDYRPVFTASFLSITITTCTKKQSFPLSLLRSRAPPALRSSGVVRIFSPPRYPYIIEKGEALCYNVRVPL